MKTKSVIAFLLMAVYLWATAGTAIVSLTCKCSEHSTHEVSVCHSGCCHDLPDGGIVRSCCSCELHSTEIELYLYQSSDDLDERYIRCTVTDLPPSIAAACPSPERATPSGVRDVDRRIPRVRKAALLPAGFRAPPVAA